VGGCGRTASPALIPFLRAGVEWGHKGAESALAPPQMDRCYHIPASLLGGLDDLVLNALRGPEHPTGPTELPEGATRAQLQELLTLRDDVLDTVREIQLSAPGKAQSRATSGREPCPLFSLLWRDGELEENDPALRDTILDLAGRKQRGEGKEESPVRLSPSPAGEEKAQAHSGHQAYSAGDQGIDFDTFVVVHSLAEEQGVPPNQAAFSGQTGFSATLTSEPQYQLARIPIIPLLRVPSRSLPECADAPQFEEADDVGHKQKQAHATPAGKSPSSWSAAHPVKAIARKSVCVICGKKVPIGEMWAHVSRELREKFPHGATPAPREHGVRELRLRLPSVESDVL